MIPSRIKPFIYTDPLYPYRCIVAPVDPAAAVVEWTWAVQYTTTDKVLEQSEAPLPCKVEAIQRGFAMMNTCIVNRRS